MVEGVSVGGVVEHKKRKLYGAAEILVRIHEASSDEEITSIKKEAFSKHFDSEYKNMKNSEIQELERLYQEDLSFIA